VATTPRFYIPDVKTAIAAAIRVVPREECGRVIKNICSPDSNVPAAPGSSFEAHL